MLGSVALLTWVGYCTAPARAVEPQTVFRSTRTELHQRLDELKLAQPGMRTCHLGWEVRTRHFVVFSTVSADQAQWTANQMEQAFVDIGLMADHWTTVHRQPTFAIGAIGVTITDKPVHPQARPADGPDKLNYDANIFVDLSADRMPLDKQLPHLRREAFRAFLRVAQQDQVLPDWLQVGLADYVAGPQPPIDPPAHLGKPLPATGPSVGVWDRRTASDRMAPLVENRRDAQLWVRYLLEGDDARQALDLFAAMAVTVDTYRQDPFHPGAGVGAVRRSVVRKPSQPEGPLQELVNAQYRDGQLAAWLKDPEIGQPVICTEPEGMNVGLPQRELALILKLNRRFASVTEQAMQPKIVRPGTGGAQPLTPAVAGPLDLDSLYRRLTNPAGRPWATLDAEGRLLFSNETQRIAAIFAGNRYRVARREGRDLLETTLPGGKVLEAWLEENPEDPLRPIVHIKSQTYRPPGSSARPLAGETRRSGDG